MSYLPTMTTGGLPEDSPANELSQSIAGMTPDAAKMDEIAPKVIQALQTVYDPEIPVNIFEMGLIYDVLVDADAFEIAQPDPWNAASVITSPSSVRNRVRRSPHSGL